MPGVMLDLLGPPVFMIDTESLPDIPDPEDVESDSNYAYEEQPEATEEENVACLKQVDEEASLEEDLMKRFREETRVETWCKCSNCSVAHLVNHEECFCCYELDRCREKMEAIEMDDTCITEHPGFENVFLDRWVLEVAAIGLKTRKGRSYLAVYKEGKKSQSEFLRSVGYRQIVRFIFDYMGNSMRTPLHACVYHTIRAKFPSDTYKGFEDEEEVDDEEEEEGEMVEMNSEQ
ncbi:hypothetical protein AC249_AIPGENE27944 [Exaiptasia diaphana]|nr:hypothetical protein AC249_AIPGENE27944 [Exaiptasia diaphana]